MNCLEEEHELPTLLASILEINCSDSLLDE